METKPESKLVLVSTKRTDVTLEFDEVVLVSSGTNDLRLVWCVRCESEVTMITPQQAALLANVSVRTVNRRVEEDKVHFIETSTGLLLICLNSLRDELNSLTDDQISSLSVRRNP